MKLLNGYPAITNLCEDVICEQTRNFLFIIRLIKVIIGSAIKGVIRNKILTKSIGVHYLPLFL